MGSNLSPLSFCPLTPLLLGIFTPPAPSAYLCPVYLGALQNLPPAQPPPQGPGGENQASPCGREVGWEVSSPAKGL